MKPIPTATGSVAAWCYCCVLWFSLWNKNVAMGGSSNNAGRPWGTTTSGTTSRRWARKEEQPFVGLPHYSQESNGMRWGEDEEGKKKPLHRNHKQVAMVLGSIPSGGSIGRSHLRNRYGYADADFDIDPASEKFPSLSLVRILGTLTRLLISMGRTVLPPVVGTCKYIVAFYGALPIDAITAQIGLVYCFLGGYYPTLFSSLQAARYCGWNIAVNAISDLTDEAIKVIDEIDEVFDYDKHNFDDDDYDYDYDYEYDNDNDNDHDNKRQHRRNIFLHKTQIVLKTVDPIKINTAAGALYTTWLGISTILQREYARVISLSLTLAEGMEKVAGIFLVPALRLVIPTDYRRWVPVLVGWAAKAASMRIAWRIERVLTAATSAIAGGALVARSLTKMIASYRKKKQQREQEQQQQREQEPSKRRRRRQRNRSLTATTPENENENDVDGFVDDSSNLSVGEQLVGFAVGGLGFYTQIETQYKRKFSFVVPFPYSLVTWPFDLAERWIQWHIVPPTTTTTTMIK